MQENQQEDKLWESVSSPLSEESIKRLRKILSEEAASNEQSNSAIHS